MSLAFYKPYTEDLMLAFTWGQCCGEVPLVTPPATTRVVIPVGYAGIYAVPIFPTPCHTAHRAVGDMDVAAQSLSSWSDALEGDCHIQHG